mmetsp:Transcript_37194/g.111060  ORF Transcript_37194/g.111060 Transcript_37194/m.111060 type:complete len:248 (+) Transcript_37194:342-1085(+)
MVGGHSWGPRDRAGHDPRRPVLVVLEGLRTSLRQERAGLLREAVLHFADALDFARSDPGRRVLPVLEGLRMSLLAVLRSADALDFARHDPGRHVLPVLKGLRMSLRQESVGLLHAGRDGLGIVGRQESLNPLDHAQARVPGDPLWLEDHRVPAHHDIHQLANLHAKGHEAADVPHARHQRLLHIASQHQSHPRPSGEADHHLSVDREAALQPVVGKGVCVHLGIKQGGIALLDVSHRNEELLVFEIL